MIVYTKEHSTILSCLQIESFYMKFHRIRIKIIFYNKISERL